MKLNSSHIFFPKNSLALKKYLLGLNRDVDRIKDEIFFNRDHGFCFNEHSISVTSSDLCNIERMVLFLEDRRFFFHNGFESRSIPRGLKRFLRGRGLGGMSTIEQQVVRIVTRKRERTIKRKFNESLLALALNYHCSKKEIFDYYIHFSYFGYKLEGCEIASQFVFGLPAIQLSNEQAAFLASLLPLPLPKAVYQAIQSGKILQGSNPSDIVSLSQSIAPRWANRIQNRMDFAINNYDFKANRR